METLLRIELLGGLRVRRAERVITRFRTQRTALLLAYLAYHRHRSHPRETLIELLWPEADPQAARHSLSQALSSLRHQLEPPGIPAGAVIVADRTTVELNTDAFETDVAEFEEALRLANQTRHRPEHHLRLTEAVERYSGPLLPGYYEDWIQSEQSRLRERFLDAAVELVQVLERRGELSAALAQAQRAVSADPLSEAAHQALIGVLLARGQPNLALRAYRELEQILQEELDAGPSASSRQLLRRIEAEREGASEKVTESPTAGVSPSHGPAAPTGVRVRQPEPPKGTVTFLLTDIEGSTALWERLGDAFPALLQSHHDVLRGVFRRYGGHELGEAGDGFVVAFGTAGDALDCARACQKALTSDPAAGSSVSNAVLGALPVRMALHSGDVERVDEGYRSLALHRAARILDAGHGGQLLCSETTASLLRHEAGGQIHLEDLGLFRLRGSEAPACLFQVEFAGATRRDFPPLRAEPVHRGRVPLQFDRFFGREEDLATLSELLAPLALAPGETARRHRARFRPRLITLVGPGGTGKTRLAIEAAGQMLDVYRGAVWFVPLADLRDPRLVPGAILDALGLARSAEVEPLAQVAAALERQPSLLVLDNLEQFLSADQGGAEVVHTLLMRVPSLICLVTSRQVLGLPGEREYRVPPLPTPNGADSPEQLSLFDSVRLFTDRAQSVKPDFQITNGNAPAVAELCDRLEGIPLAIELAAARAVVLTPNQMLAQLSNRFALLVGRRRGVAARHRTLRAALDWSYHLLAPEMQQFFAQLGVFRGGWTVEAAEAVCGERLALDHLEYLRECSLILAEESSVGIRFRMMETLQEYAASQLALRESTPDAPAAEISRSRHAAFFLDLAEEAAPQVQGTDQQAWVDRLEADHDNFRAALDHLGGSEDTAEAGLRMAGALGRFWAVRGHFTEGRRWIETLHRQATGARESVRAKALTEAAALARTQNDYGVAQPVGEEVLGIWRALGDSAGTAAALTVLGHIAADQGDYYSARSRFEGSLALRRAQRDLPGIAASLDHLGSVATREGKHAVARPLYEESLALRREIAAPQGIAISLNSLGCAALYEGDYAAARSMFEESLRISREIGNPVGIATQLTNLGWLGYLERDYTAAGVLLAESLQGYRELGATAGIAFCLEGFSLISGAQGAAVTAVRLWGAAARLRTDIGVPLPTVEHALHEPNLIAMRDVLGADAFNAALAEGAALSAEQAAALALGRVT